MIPGYKQLPHFYNHSLPVGLSAQPFRDRKENEILFLGLLGTIKNNLYVNLLYVFHTLFKEKMLPLSVCMYVCERLRGLGAANATPLGNIHNAEPGMQRTAKISS